MAEIYKDYEWPETDIGDYGSSDCPCSDVLGTLAGRAFRICGGDGVGNAQWSEKVNVIECVAITSDTTKRLCQIAQVRLQSCATQWLKELFLLPCILESF